MARMGTVNVKVVFDNEATAQHLRNAIETSQRVAGRYPDDKDAELVVALLEAVAEGVSVQVKGK